MIKLHIRVTLSMNGLATRQVQNILEKEGCSLFMKWKQKIYKAVLSNNDYNKLISSKWYSGSPGSCAPLSLEWKTQT